MDWKKPQTIIGSITGVITIAATIILVYNWVTPRHEHEALAKEVHEEYVTQDELVAVNKNVQQTNYQFWIIELKRQIGELYQQLKTVTDPIEKQRILDEIKDKQQDLQNFKNKLNEMK